MKLNEMKVVAAEMYKAKQPTMFWGAPEISFGRGLPTLFLILWSCRPALPHWRIDEFIQHSEVS